MPDPVVAPVVVDTPAAAAPAVVAPAVVAPAAAPVVAADPAAPVRPPAMGAAPDPAAVVPPVAAAPAVGEALAADDWRMLITGGDQAKAAKLMRYDSATAYYENNAKMEQRWSDARTARLPVKPGADATAEQIATYEADVKAFNAKVGVPETPDKYEIKLADGYKPTPLVEAGLGMVREIGVKAGFNNDQAQALAEGLVAWEAQSDAEFEAEGAALENTNMEGLREVWGPDFDANWKLAEVSASQFLDPYLKSAGIEFGAFMDTKLADGTRIGTNPVFARLFAGLGREFQSDPHFNAILSGAAQNPATLETRVSEIQALNDGTRAGKAKYDAAMPELIKLNDQLRAIKGRAAR